MNRRRTLFLVQIAFLCAGSGCAQKSEKNIVNTPELAAVAHSCTTETPVYTSGTEPIVGRDAGPSLDRENATVFTDDSSIAEGDTCI